MTFKSKRILISGAGIAGPALAWWLHRFGFEPTLVEIAPRFRSGGYIIDFWGKGYDLAERMGLLPEIERRGYHLKEVRFVHSDGSRAGGFSAEPFYDATGGRFISLPRGELAETIWNSLPDSVECRFGDEIVAINPSGGRARVRFARSRSDDFDFVIGADGLHSRVRELCFGPEAGAECFLGYAFAAFTVANYEPRTADVYMNYGVAGRQASRFAMRGGRTLILFIWREESHQLLGSETGANALLRARFGDMGWEVPKMLAALEGASDLYIDAVSQIRMPRWSRGRVALTGDAAWAPSFLAGEGCGLGIIGAYVLAGELARSGGEPRAFEAYERRLRPFMQGKQKMAARFAGAFAPKTSLGIALRNIIASTLNIPFLAKLALASTLNDDLELPSYDRELAG